MSEDPRASRSPNQTVSDPSSEQFRPLPRDESQPIHKKPRVFIHRPNEDPDEENEARKHTSMVEAAKTIKVEDFTKVHQTPCVRDALLPGIGSGMGIGAVRFVAGGSVNTSVNFAMGSFMAVSVVTYQYCQRQRRTEKENIRKAVKVLDEKQAFMDAQSSGGAGAQKPELPKVLEDERNKPVSFWSTFKFW